MKIIAEASPIGARITKLTNTVLGQPDPVDAEGGSRP